MLPTFKQSLKHTTSKCPVCRKPCPGEVWKAEGEKGRVYLTRTCPDHGGHDVCIATDARFHWLAKGDPANACGPGCACPSGGSATPGTLGQNAGKPGGPEELSTCLALIEIVDSCNLACPTCFADSPTGTHADRLLYHPFEQLRERILGVLDRKGSIEILQLSGGEPTLHPEFFKLLDWIHAEPRIDYCLLNTNGLRLKQDPEFLDGLAERAARGAFQLYLQFDGPGEAGQKELRGADLRATKMEVMRLCDRKAIPFTLAMTVTPANLDQVWPTIEVGLPFDACRGVSFQPAFGSGRVPGPTSRRLNAADVVLELLAHPESRLSERDLTPLPCGDPNCAIIGYLLRTPVGVRSISEFIDFTEVQGFLRDKVRYELADLIRCGCENTELGEILHRYEMKERHAFRVFIKPFMDEWDWDEDRIDRCCTHVIRPDGQLDSFCRYYARG
ncbi:radical SAM domain-containing protein [Haloferula helveola]|uniref:Radical SAM domain-containing protein n=1 Tax=Haloferula helveola TaxID=490095 RepID=A0ABM7RFA8_9BACT|nr:radical SAM domain-containing protein [Haloferula helveola]